MKLKRSSILVKIVILALIVYGAVTLTTTRARIATAEADRAALRAQVDTTMQENAALEYDIEHANDPETIADIARTKLGLVLPGEKILYDVSN
jgi:cell division protein FtsL